MEIFMQNTFCFGTRAKPKNSNMEGGNTQHSILKLCIDKLTSFFNPL